MIETIVRKIITLSLHLRIVMATKEYYKTSEEHGGVNAGAKFITVKAHHEVQGDIAEGGEMTLDSIAHFPTRYRLKDDSGRIWTVPIHTVIPLDK